MPLDSPVIRIVPVMGPATSNVSRATTVSYRLRLDVDSDSWCHHQRNGFRNGFRNTFPGQDLAWITTSDFSA
jgi:hypothetical protein